MVELHEVERSSGWELHCNIQVWKLAVQSGYKKNVTQFCMFAARFLMQQRYQSYTERQKTADDSRAMMRPGLEKKLGFWKRVFRLFRFFLYEDRTRKYDPKAHKNIPHTTHPTPLILRTTAWTTTNITLTGYKQQYMIMRLKLKGNNKPLLIMFAVNVIEGQFV